MKINNALLEKIKDPKFYLENFCQVRKKEGGFAPFVLKEFQKDLFNTLRDNKRIIILKARQIGCSTALCGYAYHFAITNPGVTVALIGYNEKLAAEFLDKIKTFYNTSPKELRPTIQYDSRFELSFPKVESKILVLSNSVNVGVGYTINFCLISELPRWEKAEEKMMGLRESIPKNGIIVIEGCVTGDTLVLTNNGPVYIKDIHDWKNNSFGFSKGKKIMLDGHYGIQPTSTYYNAGIKKGFMVKTKCGYEIGMSDIHKLFVLKNEKLEFVESKNLRIGDILTIKYGQELWGINDIIRWKPSEYGFNKKWIKQFNPKIITEDLAYLIGLILGDGSIYKDKSVIITNIDKDVTQFVLNNNLGLKFYQGKNNNSYHYKCTNKSFILFLREYIGFIEGRKSRQKEIPKVIFTWSRKNIIAFLQGLFDTDGSCHKNRGVVSLVSTSKQIIDVVRLLLLNFGIISRTYFYNAPPSKKVKVWSSGYRLEINRSHSQIFMNKIGFRIKRKQNNKRILKGEYSCLQEYVPIIGKILKKNMKVLGLKYSDVSNGMNKGFFSKSGNITYYTLGKILNKCRNKDSVIYKNIKELYDKKYFYDEIKEIKPIEENVYDFTVDKGHTVVTNGFVGHNTPKGMGNLFHRLWTTSKEFVKKEYGWWWEYTQEEMDKKKEEIGPVIFSQEYGMKFLSSGRTVFEYPDVEKQIKNILKVGDKRIIDENEFIVYEKDGWTIYREPEKDGLYVCGVDVGGGISGGDYSVATIWNRKTGEEVAMYRRLVAPDRFGEILNLKCREYNNAYLVIEINNHGLTTLTVVKQKIYPAIYFRPAKYETIESKISDRMGWRTTKITRPLLIDDLGTALREESIIIHSKFITDEMFTFIYDDNGDMVTMSGFHDDGIFSSGIALQGFKIMYSGELTQLDETQHLPHNYSY